MAIAVNDFSPEELALPGASKNGDGSSQAKIHRPAAE
jgi:hypothetical protein